MQKESEKKIIQFHNMSTLFAKEISPHIISGEEDFVIEKFKEAWDIRACWQEKPSMIFSKGNFVKLQFLYVEMLCD